MGHAADDVASGRFGGRQRGADAAHFARRDTDAAQAGEPCRGGAGGDQRLEDGEQLVAVGYARAVAGKALVGGKVGSVEQPTQCRELAVVADRDDDLAVAGGETFVGNDGRVAVAEARGFARRHQRGAGDIGHHRQLAIIKRHVDVLANPVPVERDQGGEDRLRGGHAGEQVGDGDPDLDRFAVGFSGHRHQPGFGLDDIVIAGAIGDRRNPAIARYRAIDQAGKERGKRGVVEAIFVEPAKLVIFDQHVGTGGKVTDDRLAVRRGEVDRDASLVAVGAQVIGRFAPGIGRAPVARVVPAAGMLDLDDLGAKVGEDHRRPRPGENSRQVEDTAAGKGRKGLCWCRGVGHGAALTGRRAMREPLRR